MTNRLEQQIQKVIAAASDYNKPDYSAKYLEGLETALRLVRDTPQIVVIEFDGMGVTTGVFTSMPAHLVCCDASTEDQVVDKTELISDQSFDETKATPEWDNAHGQLTETTGLTLADFLPR